MRSDGVLPGPRRNYRGAAVIALLLQPVALVGIAMPARALQPGDGVATAPHAAAIIAASQRFGIPEAWIRAVMQQESAGNPRAVSTAGAIGLMQIMPGTWAILTRRYDLGGDPFAIQANIMAGAAYLREMHDRYGDPVAMLAAYNAGPGRYDAYRTQGRPLPGETIAYVARLAPKVGGGGLTPAGTVPLDPDAWRSAALFAVPAHAAPARPDDSGAAAVTRAPHSPDAPSLPASSTVDGSARGLFVVLSGGMRP